MGPEQGSGVSWTEGAHEWNEDGLLLPIQRKNISNYV